MSDTKLVVYLTVFGILGAVFSTVGLYAVKAASGTRVSGQGRGLVGGLAGLALGLVLGVIVEVVASHVFKLRSDLTTAALTGAALGALAGVSGGVLRGAAAGTVAGLFFGNLVVTTRIELLTRLVAMIGGMIAGVWVSVMYEAENPTEPHAEAARGQSESQEAESRKERQPVVPVGNDGRRGSKAPGRGVSHVSDSRRTRVAHSTKTKPPASHQPPDAGPALRDEEGQSGR